MPNQVLSQMLLFNSGLADQVNKDLVANGYALQLHNAVKDKLGRIVKRSGHTKLTPTGPSALDPANAGNAWQLASRMGAPLLLSGCTTGAHLRQYLADSNSMAGSVDAVAADPDRSLSTGFKLNVRPKRWTVAGDLSDAKNGSCAYAGGLLLATFDTAGGFVRRIVQELESGATIFDEEFVGTKAKAVAVNGYLVMFYVDFFGVLNWVALNSASPTTATTTSGNFGVTGGSQLYDVHAYSSTSVAIAFQDSAAPTTTVQLRQWGLPGGTTHTSSVAISATMAMSWINDRVGTGYRSLAYAGANGVGNAIRTSTLALFATMVLDASATANVRNITGVNVNPSDPSRVRVLWEVSAASSINHRIKMARVEASSVVTDLLRGCGLRSKIFHAAGPYNGVTVGQPVFIASYDSDVQPTYFLMWLNADLTLTEQQATPQAKLLPLAAGGHTESTNSLCEPASISSVSTPDVEWVFVATKRSRIESEGSTLTVERHLEAFRLDFDAATVGAPKEIGPWMLCPGGNLRAFDGKVHREWLFDLRPEAPTVTSVSTGSGVLTPGDVRSYRAVYAVTDSAGMVHRSAPSVQVSGTVGVGHNALSVAVPTLRITSQSTSSAAFQGVTIELYATEANQGAAGLAFQLIRQFSNSLTADTASVVDIATNTQQNSGTVLYSGDSSTGSELDNIAPPGLVDVCAWRNRIVGISAEKPTELWISKNMTINAAPGFSESLVVDCQEEMTAIASLDDQLFLFSASRVYRVIDEPPDDTGSGTLPRPQRIGDVGTTYPRMVAVHEGIWFQSGLRLLRVSRGAQVEYGIGDAAESVVRAGTPVCGIAIPERSQVRWYYADGSFVIYDDKRSEWSTCRLPVTDVSSQLVVRSAISYNGNALLLIQHYGFAVLWLEDDDVYTDPGQSATPVNIVPQIMGVFLSADSKLGQIRIHEVQAFGEVRGSFTLQIDAFINFNRDTPVETVSGTYSVALTAKYKPKYRRCESFAARLSEYAVGVAAPTAGMALTGMLIRYSIESGRSHRGNANAMT